MPTLKSEKGYAIVISGRCGMVYYDENNNEYLIDTEMVISPQYDFVLSHNSVSSSRIELTQNERSEIIKRIVELCKSNNINILISE